MLHLQCWETRQKKLQVVLSSTTVNQQTEEQAGRPTVENQLGLMKKLHNSQYYSSQID